MKLNTLIMLSICLINTIIKSAIHNKKLMMIVNNKYPTSIIKSQILPTLNQKIYVDALKDTLNDLIVCNGPAGTGKTMFACIQAIKLLQNNEINKIIITRPTVSIENEQIGFLPGTINEKMDPWIKPIMDVFNEYLLPASIGNYIHQEKIEIIPLYVMRGRTFNNSYIIADEMQNSTPDQMKMLCTRIGRESKLVITGDLLQSDLKLPKYTRFNDNNNNNLKNGFDDLITRLTNCKREINNIKLIQLKGEDVQRSKLTKQMIDIYND